MSATNGDGLPPGYPIRDRIVINGAPMVAGQVEHALREAQRDVAEMRAERDAAARDRVMLAAEVARLKTRINTCGLIAGEPQ